MEYHERRPTHALAGPTAKYARLRPERRLRKSHCIVRDSTRTTPSQVGSQHAPVPLNPHVHHASRHARLCLIRSHTVQRRRSIRDGPPRVKLPRLDTRRPFLPARFCPFGRNRYNRAQKSLASFGRDYMRHILTVGDIPLDTPLLEGIDEADRARALAMLRSLYRL